MRSLSSKVGVLRTAPYRHFKNKDALLLAIAEKGFNELTTRYQKINCDKSLGSLSKLQNITLAYIKFAIINPGPFRLMFGQEIIQHQRSEKLCSDARATFNEYLLAIKALKADKNITAVDYTVLANYFWVSPWIGNFAYRWSSSDHGRKLWSSDFAGCRKAGYKM
jgi:AcrR family transcriptional regulator